MSSQHQQLSPLIWFLLVDSATGEPYKGTSASSILLSSLVVAVVDQFRDVVKKKDKDDGDAAILSPFKSSQLIVYKNKAAFEKRNASLDEEKVSFKLLKDRRSRWKKILSSMVSEAQRRMH